MNMPGVLGHDVGALDSDEEAEWGLSQAKIGPNVERAGVTGSNKAPGRSSSVGTS